MGLRGRAWARSLGAFGLVLATTAGMAAASSVAAAATAVTLYVRSGATGTTCTAGAPCGSVARGVAVTDETTPHPPMASSWERLPDRVA